MNNKPFKTLEFFEMLIHGYIPMCVKMHATEIMYPDTKLAWDAFLSMAED
jgi:hypothetical protein